MLTGNAVLYLENTHRFLFCIHFQILRSAESSYTFVYIGDVDESGGHQAGWCSSDYLKVVDYSDELVGRLLDIVDASGRTDVAVLLNTDHGGHNHTHGLPLDDDLRIPIILRGPEIRRDVKFRGNVRNLDLAPTIAEMLGLAASPQWSGRVLWEAFEDGSK